MFRPIAAIALALSAWVHTNAWAVYPGLSVSFIDPVGEVRADESFEVWVRLSLAPGSEPLNFDGTDAANGFNLPSHLLPKEGYKLDIDRATDRPFGQWGSAGISSSLMCIGENNLESVCHDIMVSAGAIPPSTAAYEFKHASWFAVDNSPAPLIQNSSALYGQPTLQMAAGQSIDLLFGIATPKAALVGQTYGVGKLTGAIYFVGLSQPDGLTGLSTPLVAHALLTSESPTGFSRTVIASTVPEPDTWALLAVGLIGITWRCGAARKA